MLSETLWYDDRGRWSAKLPDMDSYRTLVLAFGASNMIENDDGLQALRRAYPNSTIAGCSTSGEIHDTTVNDGTLSVAVLKFERSEVKFASAAVSSESDSFAAGKSLARQLAGSSLRAVLVFSDGLAVNGTELTAGVSTHLPATVSVTGGLAGDGDRFERTWVLVGGEPKTDFVTAVGLYGEVEVTHGSQGGWDQFGPQRQITKSEGNVLYELDGQPALPLYKQYLGEFASELPASGLLFPLQITDPASPRELVRTILSVDEETQSLRFAGDVPEGYAAQLMQANFERLVSGAEDAAELAAKNNVGGGLCISISCVGRRLVLGERSEEEVEAVLHTLPEGTKQVGFYSYGEISPIATGTCELHNQTMTITTIAEAA
jgi:hypothetical protein